MQPDFLQTIQEQAKALGLPIPDAHDAKQVGLSIVQNQIDRSLPEDAWEFLEKIYNQETGDIEYRLQLLELGVLIAEAYEDKNDSQNARNCAEWQYNNSPLYTKAKYEAADYLRLGKQSQKHQLTIDFTTDINQPNKTVPPSLKIS